MHYNFFSFPLASDNTGTGGTTSQSSSDNSSSGSGFWVFNPADIISCVSSWMGSVIQGLATCITDIANGIKDFSSAVGSMLTNILNKAADIFGAIGTFSATFISFIGQKMLDLFDVIKAVPALIATAFQTLFTTLFVPDDKTLPTSLATIKAEFDSKIPIVSQIVTIVSSLFTNVTTAVRPDVTIDIPKWGISGAKVIDFSFIEKYIPYIRGITLALFWIFTIVKVFKMLPSVIGGLTSFNDSDWHENYTAYLRDKWTD